MPANSIVQYTVIHAIRITEFELLPSESLFTVQGNHQSQVNTYLSSDF